MNWQLRNFRKKKKAKAEFCVGLDIDSRSARAVEIGISENEARLMRYGVVRFDPKAGRQAKVAAMQGVINNAGIKPERVNVAISGQFVVIRYLEFPKMRKDELKKAISFELDRYTPFRPEEIYYDIYVQDNAPAQEGKLKLVLAVAKKEVVQECFELLKDAGLVAGIIDLKPFSLINSFTLAAPSIGPSDVTALIHLEPDIIIMDVLEGMHPTFSREIIGGKIDIMNIISKVGALDLSEKQELDEEAQEVMENIVNLVKELRTSLGYFEGQSQKTVNKFYFSGEAASKKLLEILSHELGQEANLWNPLQYLAVDEALPDKKSLEQDGPLLSLAIGLALRR